MDQKKNIRLLDKEQIRDWCSLTGFPAYRAGQIYEWLWKKGARSFEVMSDLPLDIRKELDQHFFLPLFSEYALLESKDHTLKAALKMHDGALIEAVLIPAPGRTTLCISTQVGCQLGCTFCATGQSGFVRDLQAFEIYDQFVYFNALSLKRYGHGLSNLVLMGMGEPLLNAEETFLALEKICDQSQGLGFSPKRVTLSTAGIPDGIIRMAKENPGLQLAVSLHSAIQEKREKIMPIAKKHTIADLTEAIKQYHSICGNRVTFEYLLLKGFNDGMGDAAELARFCKSFPVKINLIAYNTYPGAAFGQTGQETIKKWMQFLQEKNIIVHLRQSKGSDIAAACGQLAGKTEKDH